MEDPNEAQRTVSVIVQCALPVGVTIVREHLHTWLLIGEGTPIDQLAVIAREHMTIAERDAARRQACIQPVADDPSWDPWRAIYGERVSADRVPEGLRADPEIVAAVVAAVSKRDHVA